MGSFGSFNSNNHKEPKESWEFNSYIRYKNIDFGQLKGTVFIFESDNKNEIQIKGKLKQKKGKGFCLNGVESYRKNENCIVYKIKKEGNPIFVFKEDIIMTKSDNENSEISGEFFYCHICYKLNLALYLLKPKIEKSKIVINNYQYSLLKFSNPVDIISNSLCGMHNLINTCYINSSFQILIHIPQFVEIIRENNDFEGNVIGNINCIFDMILINYKKNNKAINPSIFVDNFKKEHIEYYNHYQKDSEMFLEELIWNINSQLSILNDKRISYYFDKNLEKEKLFYDYIKETENDSYYKIYDLCYVCFVHEKICEECNYKTYYFDDSAGLKLNFKKTDNKSFIDLYTLIMENFKNPERIKSSFNCQNCNKCFYVLDKTRIAKLPKILILSLQKTNNDSTEKIPWIVKYDTTFGIKEIVDIDLYKHRSCSYEIFAINNHVGYSTKSGHYFSTIYLEQLKTWFNFNDESVYPISEVLPNLNNYILFYKQKK